MEEFKIALGAELKSDASSDISAQIKSLHTEPIKLKLDTDSAKSKLKTIKKQMESLNDIKVTLNTGTTGSKSGNKNLLPISPVDVSKLTQSLDKLDASLENIRMALGSIDDSSGMQSILATINQVNASLSEMSKQFKTVEQMFNGASFNLNFNLGLGGKNDPIARNAEYGTVARKTIGQLREQYNELQNIFYEYGKLNNLLTGNDKSSFMQFKLMQFGGRTGQGGNILDLTSKMNGGSVRSQMETYQELINFAKQAAKANNIDLSAFDAKFGNSADKLVENVEKIQSGEAQMEESMQKLQNIFGSTNNINLDGVATQLDSIINKLEELNQTAKQFSGSISFDGLTESFRELSTSIQQIVESCTRLKTTVVTGFSGAETTVGQSVNGISKQSKEVTSAFKELSKVSNKIKNIDTSIAQLEKFGKGTHTNEINELRSQLNDLIETYNKLESSLNGQLSSEQLTKLAYDIADTINKLAQLDARAEDTRANLAKDIKLSIEAGDLDKDLSNINTALNNLEVQSAECEVAVREFNTALTNLRNANEGSDIDVLINAQEEYEKALERVNNQLKINTNNQKQANKVQKQAVTDQKLDIRKEALSSGIDVWLKKNSAAAKQFGAQLQTLKSQIASCDAMQLDKLEGEFKEVQRSAQLAGVAGLSLGDKLKRQFSQYSSYLSVASMFSYAEQAIRSMYNNVIEVDTAMTNLYKVTDETAGRYEQFMTSASKNSQELGRSLSSFIEQTANWAKMGFDIGDSEELAKLSSIYANVADLDDATAVSDLVTVIKAYGIEAENAITIVDSLNKISNEFAVTAAGLGQGLTKAAASMATSGTEFEKTIAMLTGIAEITQSPEEAGNFLKVATMRIQGMKGKLEELGEEVDDSVDSISKVQTQILNLTHGEVNIFDDAGEFRDYYEIMEDISEVVNDLTSTDRASLYEILFGKQRANQGAALVKAFQSGQINKAYKAAQESAGSAYAEQEKWAESLEAKLGSLESAWQSLSNTFLDSDFLKGAIDALTEFVNTLDWIVNKIGTFNTAVGGLFIGNVVKDIMSASSAAGGFTSVLSGAANNAGIAKTAISGLWKVISAHPILAAVGAVGLLVAAFDKIHVSAKEANEKMATAFDEYDEAKQKVIDVNTELDTTKSRMEELQAKGGLTFVEQQELEDLREATELLQIQADLAEKEEQRKAKEAAASVATAYEKNFKNEISKEATDKYTKDAEWSGNNAILFSDEKNISAMIAGIRQMEKLRDEAKKLRDEAEYGSDEWSYYNDDFAHFSEVIDDATASIWEQTSVLAGYAEKLKAVPTEELTQEQKDLLQVLSNSIDYIYKELDPAKWKQMQFDKIFDDKNLSDAKNELVEMAAANKTVGVTVDDIINKYPELAEAIRNAGFEVQDLIDYINSEAGAINVDEYVRQAKEELAESMSEVAEDAETDAAINVEAGVEVNKEASLSEINEWLDSLDPEDKVIVCDIIFNNDTSGWALDEFKKKLEEIKKPIEDSIEPIKFEDLFVDDSDAGFKAQVDAYIEKIETLKEALDSIKSGEFTTKDRYDLESLFPQLVGSDNLKQSIADLVNELTGYNTAVDATGKVTKEASGIMAVFEDAFGRVDSEKDRQQLEAFMKTVLELGQVVGSTAFAIDIDVEAGNMKNLYDAINESVSGTGLSSESIKNIENMYSNLEGYDPSKLFELTEHGIHMNVQELRSLQSEYESFNKNAIKSKLQDLKQEYNNVEKELAGLTEGTDAYNQKMLERDGILAQIKDVQTLMAQYEGLTSAYNKWMEAQSTGNENDMYLNLSESIKSAKELYKQGWIGTDDFRSWVQMMTDEDLSTASVEKILQVYEKGMPAMERFFTGNTNGLLNFLNDAKYVSEKLGEDFVTLDKNGKWHIDFEGIGDEEFAKAFSDMTGLQISAEQLQIILRALSAAGFDVNLKSAYASVEELQSKVEETEAAVKKLGAEPVDIDIYCDVESLDTEINKAKTEIEELRNSDLTLEVNAAKLADAEAKLDVLIQRKIELSQPAFMSIDVSEVDTELQEALVLLQNYQTAVNNLKALEIKGADTSEIEAAKKKVDDYAAAVNGLPEDVKTKIGVTTENVDAESLDKLIADKEITIPVSADTTQASTDIEGLSESATVTMEAQLGDSFDSVGQYVAALNNHVSTITIDAKLGDGFDVAGRMVQGINETTATVTVDAELGDGFDTAGKMVQTINDTVATMTADAELGDGFDKVGTYIAAINETTATMTAEVELGDSFNTAGAMIGAINDTTSTMTVEAELGDGFDVAGRMMSAIDQTTVDVTIDAELGGGFDTAGRMLQGINETTATVTIDAELGDGFDTAGRTISGINQTTVTMTVDAKLGNGFDTAGRMIQGINETTATVTIDVDDETVQDYEPPEKEAEVKYSVNDEEVDEFIEEEHETTGNVTWNNVIDKVTTWANKIKEAIGIVRWGNDVSNVKTHFSATGTINWKNSGGNIGAGGTANVNGTAYARGDWGTKDSGTALVGELGPELVVRGSHFFTIGDNGTEFFDYKQGDIIFNAEQTKQILEKGKITTGARRGTALANGTAFAEGTAFKVGSNASGQIIVNGKVTTTPSKGSDGDGGGSDDDAEKEFKETFDWIEVAIDRIERAISRLDLKANSVYKSWSDRNKNLKKEISAIEKEIDLQARGYQRYLDQANSVGLDESWAKLVREGKIDISTITDEDLAEQISEYQEWYEKALDCRDAIDELSESLAECYKIAFDNVVTQYDNILAIAGHEKSMIEEYIAQSEAKGHITSTKYYKALMKAESSNIKKLEKEKAELIAALEAALASGAIEKGSEAWQEMCIKINAVTLAIEQSNTAVQEYANAIRDIEWEVFDLLQDQISDITEEADFLIDLMSNDKLYDDRGQLTNEGMSTMGLHGMNYNVYMAQADRYAQEINKLNQELARDPYNQDLIKRRQELLELQRESILAAEDEKQAIVDMVREGIELELDALQELIDKYTEALDSQKDLYDYQKKIAEQTENIASLEKQMSAYQGDDSEETRSKIQQIKVDLEKARENLEETEYERYISDQKQLLDELYTEYELILNQRLDNIDALLEDMIAEINSNASVINSTLSTKADEVGYTLSDAMKTTWDTSTSSITNALSVYGSGVQARIDSAIARLDVASAAMKAALDINAMNEINAITTYGEDVKTSVDDAAEDTTTEIDANTAEIIDSINANSAGIQGSIDDAYLKLDDNARGIVNAINTNGTAIQTSIDNATTKLSSAMSSLGSNINSMASKISSSASQQTTASKGIISTAADIIKSGVNAAANVIATGVNAAANIIKTGAGGGGGGQPIFSNPPSTFAYTAAHRDGVYKISEDELAWTQEGRELEAIIRPSDGAILTPLAKNDSVLKASATSNIFNFANDPSGFIRDNLNIVGSVSDVSHQQSIGGTYHNDVSFKIELPNVTNYEEFKYAMQHDKNFEKMVRAMTVDKMFGGSSLKKYKY